MPFLKKLILYGFKSFAYKTELEFKAGILSIVGPNGCGKSNIVESLKWVFGERGAKNLRGENVTDIIFAGTEVNKPVGLAEVEVIIDNSDMTLPLKYNEISIKRKIFRASEPEYYINKNSVRLKDIHDLLSDTGIGKASYSFMKQGEIDTILNTKPEERRSIFEEAAGIAKYKSRKKETLSKLELTNNNLGQVNILLNELENERKSLKSQAEKTKVYNKNNDKLKKLEIQLSGNKYKRNIRKLQEINNKINQLNDRKIKLKTENSSLNSEIEKINNMIFKFNQTKNEFEKERLACKMKIDANNDKINHFNSLNEKNSTDIKLKKKQIDEFKKENKNINENITLLKEGLEKYRRELEENEKKLKEVNQQQKSLNDKKILNIKEKEKLKFDIDNNSEQVEELRVTLRKVTDEFIAQIDKKKKELEGKQYGQHDIKTKIDSLLNKITEDSKKTSSKNVKEKSQEIISDLQELKELIQNLFNLQDEFRNLIFDEKGPYAEKEKIDQHINQMLHTIISCQNKISLLETENERFTKQLSELSAKYSELDMAKNDLKHYINNSNKDIRTNMDSLTKNDSYTRNLEAEIKNIENNSINLKSEIAALNREIESYLKRSDNIDKQILKYEEDMNENRATISKRKDKLSDLVDRLEGLEKSIENQNATKYKTEELLNSSKHFLYQEFNVKVDEILDTIPDNINEKKINEHINSIKHEIKELGHVNLLAEEFYEDVDKRYKFHIEQKEDLLKARADLMKIIEEINKESEKIFLDTLNQIRKNFHNLFRQIFGGGKADLILLDPDNALECGIEIYAQPPGKKVSSYNLLSGGERALLAIGLMFSIFLVKPSPFCIMDEIDAALDEQNNLRFLKILNEFAKKTQFLIVTHNKQTIVNSNYLYGVTMEEKGISKIVSLELKKEKIDDYIK